MKCSDSTLSGMRRHDSSDAECFWEPGEEVAWKVVLFFVVYFLTIVLYILCLALAKLDGFYRNSNVLGYLNGCFVDSGSTEPVGAWRSDGDRTIAHQV